MSWITVDTKLAKHAKMAALPSDSARWGWIVTLLEAKEQRTPGTFASAKHFRLVMDRHGKYLPDYIAAKLLDEKDDGTLQVHDWKRHQWAGTKAQQRETSDGHSEDNARTNDGLSSGQKEDASRAVPVYVPVGTSSDGVEVQGEGDDVFAFLAQQGAFVRPDSGFGIRLSGLIDRRGEAVVLEKARSMVNGEHLSDRQWVFGLEKALEAIPSPPMDELPVGPDPKSQAIYDRMVERRLTYFRETGLWPEGWGPAPVAA